MSDLLDKISAYDLLNSLLPGALFVALVDQYSSYTLPDDVLVAAFLIYFIGLVISRIGSLIVEPLFTSMNLITFAPYERFVAASKSDKKLEVLSEVNNMYRTLVSFVICVFAFLAFDWASGQYPAVSAGAPYIAGVAVLVLFYCSWKKQSGYIAIRIANAKDDGKDKPQKQRDRTWRPKR